MGEPLTLYHRGMRRIDANEFLASNFELQLRYNGKWVTYSQPHPLLAHDHWKQDLRRWPSFAMRLLRNNKVVRSRL